MHEEKLYTTEELTKILNVSRRTVYNWVKSNKITSTQLDNGSHIFLQSDIDYYIKKQSIKKAEIKMENVRDKMEETMDYFNYPKDRKHNELSRRQAIIWLVKGIETGEIIISKKNS